MPNDRIRGGALALLFCLALICSLVGCHHTIYTDDGPQARWGDAAVYIDATDDAVLAVNNAQQNIYVWVGKWNPGQGYVKQFDAHLGCHSQAAGRCECRAGDDMEVMFVAQGDTVYRNFILGN